MKYGVIITAAGVGSRMGLGYNKLLYSFGDKSIIQLTVGVFEKDSNCEQIVIAVNGNDLDTLTPLFTNAKIKLVKGGSCREESVYNALQHITSEYVLIHDGARCNVNENLINKVLYAIEAGAMIVFPAIKKSEAILVHGREIGDLLVQTPQGFKTQLFKKAMKQAHDEYTLDCFTDDVSLAEQYLGIHARIVKGDEKNIKITVQSDLEYVNWRKLDETERK